MSGVATFEQVFRNERKSQPQNNKFLVKFTAATLASLSGFRLNTLVKLSRYRSVNTPAATAFIARLKRLKYLETFEAALKTAKLKDIQLDKLESDVTLYSDDTSYTIKCDVYQEVTECIKLFASSQ